MRVLVSILDPEKARRIRARLAMDEPEWDVALERDGRKSLDMLRRERYELLLLHGCLPGLDGAAVLAEVTRLACPPRTLLLCEPELRRAGLADCVAPIASGDEAICRLLSTLARRPVPRAACVTQNVRRAWIESALRALALPSELKGYRYLAWMLERLAPSPMLAADVSTGLYAPCAEAFGATVASVERCARHAIERTFMLGDLGGIEELFGTTIDPERGKPTNRAFLVQLAERLRQECYAVA